MRGADFVSRYDYGNGRVEAASQVRLAFISASVPAVADQLIGAGVDGILNLAPMTLSHPWGIPTIGEDWAMELEQLPFAVVNQHQNQ